MDDRHGLPYVDAHSVDVAEETERVWDVVERFAVSLTRHRPYLLTRAWGTTPPSGFEVTGLVPPRRAELSGRHRFSRCALVLDLEPGAGAGTVLRATTYAEFPGQRGRAYRLLAISSRLHVLATVTMLRRLRRRSGSA